MSTGTRVCCTRREAPRSLSGRAIPEQGALLARPARPAQPLMRSVARLRAVAVACAAVFMHRILAHTIVRRRTLGRGSTMPHNRVLELACQRCFDWPTGSLVPPRPHGPVPYYTSRVPVANFRPPQSMQCACDAMVSSPDVSPQGLARSTHSPARRCKLLACQSLALTEP